jgi:hypothetical protein
MDENLKLLIEGLEERLIARVDTLSDRLAVSEQQIIARIDTLSVRLEVSEQHMIARIDTLSVRLEVSEQHMIERMRDMQTELLKAYLPAQEAANARDAALEA